MLRYASVFAVLPQITSADGSRKGSVDILNNESGPVVGSNTESANETSHNKAHRVSLSTKGNSDKEVQSHEQETDDGGKQDEREDGVDEELADFDKIAPILCGNLDNLPSVVSNVVKIYLSSSRTGKPSFQILC